MGIMELKSIDSHSTCACFYLKDRNNERVLYLLRIPARGNEHWAPLGSSRRRTCDQVVRCKLRRAPGSQPHHQARRCGSSDKTRLSYPGCIL